MTTASGRLSRAEVAAHLGGLRLTAVQASRLRAIVDLLADDGRFRLRDALVAGEFSDDDARAQDAFQDFRRRVNAAAERAGVPLALELDAQKTTPDTRYGWFVGGDLVDAGLAAFTGSAADRTGVAHPVEQAVAEVGASRRTRVYVSHAPADARLKVGLLLDRLRTDLALDGSRTWEVDDTASPRLGEEVDPARDRLAARADVRVALLSPAYLLDRAERDRVFGASGPTVAFVLGGLPDGEVDLAPLRRWEIGERDRPWDVLTRPDQRQRYIRRLVDGIRTALDRPAAPAPDACPPDEVFARYTDALAQRRRGNESTHVIPGEAGQTTLSASLLDRPDAAGPPLPAVDRLVEWATDVRADAPRLCALLGDVGMGKTTTAKLFARTLLDRRERDPRVPLPILFDLRDVRTTDLAAKLSTDHVLTSMFEHNRATDGVAELSAAAVRRRIAQGGAVVIFDGLDEVLVHLEPPDQRLFTAQLFRAVEERSGSRMLLTCRTQYFRTLREETGYFVGHDREGLRGENYLALVMLPFRPDQVRAYLAANLKWDDARVGEFLDTIAAVHDLTDLASRPVTLKMIADQVRVIEAAKLRGETVRAVDLYGEFVDRWLDRDAGKHSLRPEHKRLLMEHAAARLWRDGRASWGPDDLDDWLLELLDARPDLKRRYPGWQPDLWTADFRTATFLSREGDAFSFAHRSLFEYFLARFLTRALTGTDDPTAAWTLPVPSPETLDFLGQSLAALPDARPALGALARIGRRYTPRASELALAYALQAQRNDHPHQALTGVVLARARLRGWRFGADAGVAGGRNARPDAPWLSMAGADLTGADLRDAVFDRVDLTGADLSGADLTTAELHRSRLSAVRLNGARATGTILRASAIDGVDLREVDAYRTQALLCDPPPRPLPGWLIAPQPELFRDRIHLRALTGHSNAIWSVAWSADETLLATGGDGAVRVWDAATGELVRELVGHTDWVRSVAWSPDGTYLASAGDDQVVRVWDAVSGQLIRELTGCTGRVQSVVWRPEGSQLATIDAKRVMQLWDAATGELVRELTGHADTVRSVAWSPDETLLATGSDDAVRVWDAATGELVRELVGHTDWVRSVAWSPDGTYLASAGDDQVVRVWDAASGKLIRELTARTYGVQSVAWSPDGTKLATGGDQVVQIWDTVTGKLMSELIGHTGPIFTTVWSRDGSQLAAGGSNREVRVWDTATGKLVLKLSGHNNRMWSVAWSPDGTQFATGGSDRVVRVWDVATGTPVRELIGHINWVRSVAWSPDGALLASAGDDRVVRVWNAASGKVIRELAEHTNLVRWVAWSPDGTFLASAGDDQSVRVWDGATGELVRELAGHTSWGQSVAWSSNGAHLATVRGQAVQIWDVVTGELVRELTGHTERLWAMAWSPDGTYLAISDTSERMVRILDVATGELVRVLTGQTDWVRSMTWSPDGTQLAGGGGAVRVWDVATGNLVRVLSGHTNWVQSVAWSPNGSRLVSGTDNGVVRLWCAVTGDPVGAAIVMLPGGEIVWFDAVMTTLFDATAGAWRWLGWSAVKDGRMSRLPAETYGALPPLRAVAAPGT